MPVGRADRKLGIDGRNVGLIPSCFFCPGFHSTKALNRCACARRVLYTWTYAGDISFADTKQSDLSRCLRRQPGWDRDRKPGWAASVRESSPLLDVRFHRG